MALVAKALDNPVTQIAKNAGLEGAVVLDKVKNANDASFGYDAEKQVYCDLIKAGIVDPTKVCRYALENAASIAAMVLTTEALVADIPEPPAPMPSAPDMGGMY
jgi:chaperonin GroEL